MIVAEAIGHTELMLQKGLDILVLSLCIIFILIFYFKN